ncbi:hypothetical protein C2E21_5862 [Chlorella sorokiniana]|uniref:Uncharacterized protein n=1 Tax=Chlorella sorokiniana TaxID=3076 RepID=A0A2P6TN02_CHLSO|nr:hypothetical protein C2E21_5862 [Chlorella sorokiniana]|eukprot:PRW45695.1 hypothetical protein C2E21_5862 [Chlorella sorokiniana]
MPLQLFRTHTTPHGGGLHASLLGGGGSVGSTPTHRRRRERRLHWLVAFGALAAVCVILSSGALAPTDPFLVSWSLKGCPQKILELTTTMEAQYEAAKAAGLDPELGAPVTRKPKTAILNFVRYHTEVVAVTVFHFVKLRHNVTVFTRDDPFHMGNVMHPYFWKGFRKFERFFEHFNEYDNIVVATFPTCHDPTLRELLRLGLPQRYIALVHNPEYLNDTAISSMVRDHGIRLLAISPHVGNYARQVLEEQGVQAELDWIAPMMPVIYPEDCQPGSWQMDHPACNRSLVWQHEAPPPAVGNPSQRNSFCIQGKVDPARRNYITIFAEMLEHKQDLLARNFSLIILGKGGGRRDSSIVRIPEELVEAGLIRQYEKLPFQEYYEVLHSCLAVVPAFASDAYYVNKGSSSIGASLISGVPLISHRYMLKSYNFLEESAVFLADEPMSDVEAMIWVQSLPPEVREAKFVGLAALRTEMYDRNLQVLQRMLGERYMYHKKTGRGDDASAYRPYYIDMSTPLPYMPIKLNATAASDAAVDGSQAAEAEDTAAGEADSEGSERRRLAAASAE